MEHESAVNMRPVNNALIHRNDKSRTVFTRKIIVLTRAYNAKSLSAGNRVLGDFS